MIRPAFAVAITIIGIADTGVALAQVRIEPTLTVSAGAGYGSNPLLLSGNDTGTGLTTLDVRPSVSFIDGPSSAMVTANYNRVDYFNRLSSNDGYGIQASGVKQFDPRTSLRVYAGYDSQVLGATGAFSPLASTPFTPVTDPTRPTITGQASTAVQPPRVGFVPVDGDVGLLGLRQRRNLISGGASVSFLPDQRSNWTMGINASRSTYPEGAAVASAFTSYGGNVGYSRSLNEISSIGLQASANFVRYRRSVSSQIYNPQITYSRTLSALWTVNAALGASIVDDGFNSTSVSVSAQGSLCRTNSDRAQMCLSAAREPSITGFGGVRTQTSVSGTYSYRLSEVTNIGASAGYNHIENGMSATASDAVGIGNQDYWSADVNLSRQIGRRLSAIASVGYRDVNGVGQDTPADVSGRLGLSVALGRLR